MLFPHQIGPYGSYRSQVWNVAPEDREYGYIWVIIPKYENSEEFSWNLKKYVITRKTAGCMV